MEKIILFYLFTPIDDPILLKLWQRDLASSLDLKGRIIVAESGINGTLGGHVDNLKAYIKKTKDFPAFKNIDFKWSDGHKDDFPKLSVKLRAELVSFKAKKSIVVNEKGIVGGGKRLKPNQLDKFIRDNQSDVVLVDGRNKREAAIGKFKNAVVMDVEHTRDFPQEITKAKYNDLKNKKVVTYCTGGIRCEVLSKLMIDAGYKDVYQLDGGIAKYLDKYSDSQLWEGSLFVFDKRMSVTSSEDYQPIGRCVHCHHQTDNYENCAVKSCNELVLICQNCVKQKIYCHHCIKASKSVSLVD